MTFKARSGVLLLLVFLASLNTRSQQAPPGDQLQRESTTFLRKVRESVAFLSVDYKDGAEKKNIAGTCFFLYVEDPTLAEREGVGYVVTNRHMAEPEIQLGKKFSVDKFSLRLNLRAPMPGEPESVITELPVNSKTHWFFPKDDSVDLAVLNALPNESKYDIQPIPSSYLAGTADQLAAQMIEPGDPVVFAGFFYQFGGRKRMEPIIRQGILAMMPGEKMPTTLQQKAGQLYLADAHAFHGNSGSPLFVNLGGARQGRITPGDRYLLLGIISGYYPEGEKYSVPAATVLTGEVHDNSGISAVVPASELWELLNSPEVKSEREARTRMLIKSSAPTTP